MRRETPLRPVLHLQQNLRVQSPRGMADREENRWYVHNPDPKHRQRTKTTQIHTKKQIQGLWRRLQNGCRSGSRTAYRSPPDINGFYTILPKTSLPRCPAIRKSTMTSAKALSPQRWNPLS